ncbi:uncharacterized protein C8A04DRAFT_32596 [Dichotomopilus funicola]|uniref:Uncharacterized protein n=1 Tax=Dichotomopilus funicola TaxID=1934379 RepID=A0AAN6UW53_9PEZI|nr:hypothetical protein C8A04DRAFT_32596 [Dichotomopilus funicola]
MLLPLILPLTLQALPVLAGFNWDIIHHGVVPSFQWTRPFPSDGTDPGGLTVNCRHSATFNAKMYKLKDLSALPPTGLAPWKRGIEAFLRERDYVGSWDGVDHKGQDREIVVMEWADVPLGVRMWIEEQQRDQSEANDNKWLFRVFEKPKEESEIISKTVKPNEPGAPQQSGRGEKEVEVADDDKIVVFPAGAIYENLPLWVAKGSKCEGDFNNLAKYKSRAIEHSVLAWPVDHTKPQRDIGQRDITFTIEAMSVTETEAGRYSRLMWEKMHRTIRRHERKQTREERQRARKEISEGWVKDEL